LATDKTYIIAIAGPSCAGKTETSKSVSRLLNAQTIGLDSYYRDLSHLEFEQRTKFNFDEPAALDHDLLVQQLKDLTAGKAIYVPVYDFTAHNRTHRAELVEPAPFLILEGLFVLYWDDVRELCDTTVYVDAPDDICLQRRRYRDVRERGRTVESVMKQYIETVRPMAAKYVWPTKSLAEVVVSGTDSLDHCAAQVLDEVGRRTGRSPASLVASAS
jgi:uridine kinase